MSLKHSEKAVVAAVTVLTASWIAYLALAPPTTEYESFIFEEVPLTVQFTFYLALAGGTALVLYGGKYQRPTWQPGIVLTMVTYAGYYALPYSRGYVLHSSLGMDNLVHVAMIKDIVTDGHVPDLTYPATHLLGSALVFAADIPIETTDPILSFWFMMMLSVGVYVFSRQFSKSSGLAVCTLGASLPVLYLGYQTSLMPWLFGLSLLPMLLMATYRYLTEENGYLVALILLGLAIILYHPISAGLTLFAITVHLLYGIVRDGASFSANWEQGAHPMAIFGVSFLSWHILQGTVDGTLSSTVASILGGQAEGGGTETAAGAAEVGYSNWQLVYYFLVPNWGVLLVYLGVAAGACLYVFYRFFLGSTDRYHEEMVVQYAIGGILAVLFLFVEIHGTSVTRAAQYGLLFSVFLVAILFYESVGNGRRFGIAISLIVGALIVASVMYAPVSAPSHDQHLSEATVEGYSWQYDHKDMSIPTYADRSGDNFYYYHFGYEDARRITYDDPEAEVGPGPYPPFESGVSPHLGYHKNEYLEQSLDRDEAYVLLRTKDLTWIDKWPEWRYDDIDYITPADYERLSGDPTADRVYANGEVSYWMT